MKEFKAKKVKKKKYRKFLVIIFLFFFFFAYIFMFKYCKEHKLTKNILNTDFNYVKLDTIKLIDKKVSENINKPVNLLEKNIKQAVKIELKKTSTSSKKSINSKVDEQKTFNPMIYIYNTHQSEDYNEYSVYEASYDLTSKLNNSGIDTYFEEQSITTVLQANNLKYYESYNVSRNYLEQAKQKYSNLSYFFDIHRDSVSKEKSTFVNQDISYAKIMFIVGLDNNNYQENLNNSIRLNEIINNKLPGISRGIMKKQGKGVNGVYNQDFSSNLFLIEVGSNNNTKDEVKRTMNILHDSIIEYIKGVI